MILLWNCPKWVAISQDYGGKMVLFRRKTTSAQAAESLLALVWEGVETHGSQELAGLCSIQDEWLAKELLALGFVAVTHCFLSPVKADWGMAWQRDVAPQFKAMVTAEVVRHLNTAEWLVGPWLDGALTHYTGDAGTVFADRVAVTTTAPETMQVIIETGREAERMLRSQAVTFQRRYRPI